MMVINGFSVTTTNIPVVIFKCVYSTLVSVSSKPYDIRNNTAHGSVSKAGSLIKSFSMNLSGSEFLGQRKTVTISWSLGSLLKNLRHGFSNALSKKHFVLIFKMFRMKSVENSFVDLISLIV
jgi:hypothetical protein